MSDTQIPAFDSAPWRADRLSSEDEIDGSSAVWASDGDLVASVHPGIGGTRMERGIDRARLIAAAGTAAQEAREMGYDPTPAVEALPKQIRTLEHITRGLAQLLTSGGEIPESALEDLRRSAQRALASAEGSEK